MNAPFPARGAARILLVVGVLLVAGVASAQYYPALVYGTPQELAPGVTWQAITNASPAWRIHVFEVDMASRNVEVMPVFKAAGNVASSANERTSSMALRTDAIAAINAGYYDTANFLTNSYTEIDGLFIGGSSTNLRPENNRSVLGFSGNHQAIPKRTKLSNTFVPADPTDWDKIVDAIGGRGHFVTAGGIVITQDNEGTTASHNDARHPRTAIGYSLSPSYKAFLVTVDGRQAGFSEGMTYLELAQLMADLGIEESVSLDGGGSTTAWVKGEGIVNSPSDGTERAVVSSWVIVSANTMDNTVSEATVNGIWMTDTSHAQLYYLDQFITDDAAGPASVTWTPDLGEEGLYKVYAWWTSAAGRATTAPHEIVHANGTFTAQVDQTANGGRWNLLGTHIFDAGTGGSVTLTNSAAGSVSADAVRFVRVSGIPEPIDRDYTVVDVLYETDFETNVSSDFTIAQHAAGDNSFNFIYDYSAFAQTGGGFPTSIPQSPGSDGLGTHALRLAVNLANGAVNGITATLTAIAGQVNMRITFDAWINYNGGAGGGTGSTEFLTLGASGNPALVAMGSSNYVSGANQPFSGFYFAASGEGGATDDYRYYDGNGSGGATGNNAARANYLDSGASDHSEFAGVFPLGQFETNGAPGKAWLRWEILVLAGEIRLIVSKPDTTEILLCDWVTPNAGATLSNLLPHFGTMDPFSSLAVPAADNFVLIDNFKVERIVPGQLTAADAWALY